MPKAAVQQTSAQLRNSRLQPEPRPTINKLSSVTRDETSLPKPRPQKTKNREQQQRPKPKQRNKTAGAADFFECADTSEKAATGRHLARSDYEVGIEGWSVTNSNLDMSANNPENGEEVAAFDEKKLSPFYEGYDVRNLLEKWRDLPSRLTLSDWGFYIKTTRRRSQRSQVDRLVADVCSKVLSMRELIFYSLDSGAHCLMWLNSSLAQKFISGMRKGCHIIGRINGEILVKDKQNLSNFMSEHQFKEWIECGPHVCLNEKNEVFKRSLQRICQHQYTGHYMGKCIDDIAEMNCPNFDYYFCECFRRHIFIPEFYTFSHYYLMEQFLKKYETDEEFKRTIWLAKPAYLTASKGFFLIRDAREFRYFYMVRSDSCVRREGFVLQRYLPRTCTINSCKMDCRMYLLITVTNGRRVSGFFHPGYVRTTSTAYTFKFDQGRKISGNIFEHSTATELYKLANTKMPDDSEEDDDDEKKQCLPFNEACEQITTGAKKVTKGEVEMPTPFVNKEDGPGGNLQEKDFEKFHWRFKYMIEVLCAKLDPMVRDKVGTFQIFALDILIDSDAKPWLLEINSHVATEQIYDSTQCQVISNVVTEAICIMCEMLQKSIQEELIAIEIQQDDQRLAKLSRAQRLMTARDKQEILDHLHLALRKTEISQRRPPVFLQNFFWWYDTPRCRLLKPWVLRKKPVKREIPWHSRMLLGLFSRNDAIQRKNFKADEMIAWHDGLDFYKHVFWREKLEADMKNFEIEKISKRAKMVDNSGGGGASTPGASADEPQSKSNIENQTIAAGQLPKTRNSFQDHESSEEENNWSNANIDLFCHQSATNEENDQLNEMPRRGFQPLPTVSEVLNAAQQEQNGGRPTRRRQSEGELKTSMAASPCVAQGGGMGRTRSYRYRARFADDPKQ